MSPAAAPTPTGPPHARVRLAAYGTLSNGSDVQLLAQPSDLELAIDTRRSLRAFFTAAWQASPRREQSYFAFMPLEDGAHWALTRVDRLGKGAAGWVVVAWSALITLEDLGQIGWGVHRLLQNAFPAPALPAVGTTYPPVAAPLAAEGVPAVDAYQSAFDWLLRDLDLFKGRRGAIRIEEPRVAELEPLTAEGALFGLWTRLGAAREDKSFCTWSGFESADYPPLDLPFHAVFAEAEDAIQERPNRTTVTLGASADGGRGPAPLAFQLLRFIDGAPAPQAAPAPTTPDDAELVGDTLFGRYGGALLDGDTTAFAQISRTCLEPHHGPTIRAGLFVMLHRALADSPPERKAALLDAFLAKAWPILGASEPTRRATAAAVMQGDAGWPWLSVAALAALAPDLVEKAFAPQAVKAFRGAAISPAFAEALAREIRSRPVWLEPRALTLVQAIVLKCWPAAPAPKLLDDLAADHGYAAVCDLPLEPALPPRDRESLMAAVLRLRPALAAAAPAAERRRHFQICFWLRRNGREVSRQARTEGGSR